MGNAEDANMNSNGFEQKSQAPPNYSNKSPSPQPQPMPPNKNNGNGLIFNNMNQPQQASYSQPQQPIYSQPQQPMHSNQQNGQYFVNNGPQYNYQKQMKLPQFESKVTACVEAEKILKESMAALRFE